MRDRLQPVPAFRPCSGFLAALHVEDGPLAGPRSLAGRGSDARRFARDPALAAFLRAVERVVGALEERDRVVLRPELGDAGREQELPGVRDRRDETADWIRR